MGFRAVSLSLHAGGRQQRKPRPKSHRGLQAHHSHTSVLGYSPTNSAVMETDRESCRHRYVCIPPSLSHTHTQMMHLKENKIKIQEGTGWNKTATDENIRGPVQTDDWAGLLSNACSHRYDLVRTHVTVFITSSN